MRINSMLLPVQVIVLASSLSTAAKAAESTRRPTLTVDDRQYLQEEAQTAVAAAFERALSRHQEAPLRSNVVLYVHGRALGNWLPGWDHEPEKSSTKDETVPLLAQLYGSSVIMFHWPHRGGWWSFPEDYARRAAPALASLVRAVSEYRAQHPESAQIRVTLLTHSMGSIVLEQLVRERGSGQLGAFDIVLVCSPASDVDGSSKWLALLPADKTFVTINEHDPILHGDMLGNLSAKRVHGKTAPGVFYLDVARLEVKHHYFVFSKPFSSSAKVLYERFYRPLIVDGAIDSSQFTREFVNESIFALAAPSV